MTYNAIEYNIEKQTIKITDSYKEKSKREISNESMQKITKHCDNFFTLISHFLERAGNDRNDLNMAMNIFFHSLEGNFQEIAIPLKYKESANDFKEKFPLFIALLDAFNFRDGKNFLGIGLGNCEIEDCIVIKKLMKNTLQDIIGDVSSAEFASKNIKIVGDNSKKNPEFFEKCYKIFGEKLINDIFKANAECQYPDLGKNILNADIRHPSLVPIVISVELSEERGVEL